MIEVNNLNKRYGSFEAVVDLSFKLVPGEILGFLGPNGAGKSTTMKMLTGYLRPSGGTVSVWGCDVLDDAQSAQRHIGYLPEGAPSYEEMTPLDFLQFVGAARGLTGSELGRSVDHAVDTMSLQSVAQQKIETLSKGFKRRVGMAQAIIHDPDVLILDEPTDGLDPNQKHHVREMIKNLSRDKIVIISTHILEEVSAVCNRAMVLAAGQIVFDGTPETLVSQSRFHGAVTLTLADGSEAVIEKLRNIPGVSQVESVDDSFTLFPEADDHQLILDVSQLAKEQGWNVTSIGQESGRLDEVFRNLTEGASS